MTPVSLLRLSAGSLTCTSRVDSADGFDSSRGRGRGRGRGREEGEVEGEGEEEEEGDAATAIEARWSGGGRERREKGSSGRMTEVGCAHLIALWRRSHLSAEAELMASESTVIDILAVSRRREEGAEDAVEMEARIEAKQRSGRGA